MFLNSKLNIGGTTTMGFDLVLDTMLHNPEAVRSLIASAGDDDDDDQDQDQDNEDEENENEEKSLELKDHESTMLTTATQSLPQPRELAKNKVEKSTAKKSELSPMQRMFSGVFSKNSKLNFAASAAALGIGVGGSVGDSKTTSTPSSSPAQVSALGGFVGSSSDKDKDQQQDKDSSPPPHYAQIVEHQQQQQECNKPVPMPVSQSLVNLKLSFQSPTGGVVGGQDLSSMMTTRKIITVTIENPIAPAITTTSTATSKPSTTGPQPQQSLVPTIPQVGTHYLKERERERESYQ